MLLINPQSINHESIEKTRSHLNRESTKSSIKCSVDKCQYHTQAKNYCTLQLIQVGTDEANLTKIECTYCESFEVK